MRAIELTTHIHTDNHNELTVYLLYLLHVCMYARMHVCQLDSLV